MVVAVIVTLVGTPGESGVEVGGSGSVICRKLPLKGPRLTAVAAAILMRYAVPGEIPVVRAVEVGDGGTSTHCSAWVPPSTS